MPELKPMDLRKLPGSWLMSLSFIIGVAVYLFSIVVKQPTLGIFLGLATWFFLIRLATQYSTKKVIEYAEELFTQNCPEKAFEYLQTILERYKSMKAVRSYYEEKLRAFHPEQFPENAAVSEQAVELDNPGNPALMEESDVNSEPNEPVIANESVKLSFRGILILICLPFVFLPIFRQTVPFVGLWPALIILTAGISLLASSNNKWDKIVAGFGIYMAVISFALFGISFWQRASRVRDPVLNWI